MITKTLRQWTYEDVRTALEVAHNTKITGIKVCQDNGFVVEECHRGQQPWSLGAKVDEERKPVPF